MAKEGFIDPTDKALANQAIDSCDKVIARQVVVDKAKKIQNERFGHDGKKPGRK